MDDQQRWMGAIKKLPAWISGTISLVTALIGFALLLQGERRLGLAILALVGVAALLIVGVYVAFARTPPLVSGGRGVYRFEKYRP
jgi:predicted ABC-type sugar transport system permease subunit